MVMKFVIPVLLCCLIGTCLAMQPIFNTPVLKFTGSIWYSALCSLIISISIVICICFFTDRFATFRDGGAMQIPKYYILAGICGILILGFTVYCITKIGPVMTASITVSVQLIVATLASHYGWLGLEHEPINWVKILGIAFLVAGVVLVKISIK